MAECTPCYRAGHICPATGEPSTFPDAVAKCAFCEDGVECPKTKKARENPVPITHFRAPKTKPTAAFPEDAAQQETKAMAKPCKCGCGKSASENRDYAWGHKPKKDSTNGTSVAGGGEVQSAPPKKSSAKVAKKKSAAIVVAPVSSKKDSGQERAVATLVFSQQQLTHMFSMLPFEDQVLCMQAYVDRVI